MRLLNYSSLLFFASLVVADTPPTDDPVILSDLLVSLDAQINALGSLIVATPPSIPSILSAATSLTSAIEAGISTAGTSPPLSDLALAVLIPVTQTLIADTTTAVQGLISIQPIIDAANQGCAILQELQQQFDASTSLAQLISTLVVDVVLQPITEELAAQVADAINQGITAYAGECSGSTTSSTTSSATSSVVSSSTGSSTVSSSVTSSAVSSSVTSVPPSGTPSGSSTTRPSTSKDHHHTTTKTSHYAGSSSLATVTMYSSHVYTITSCAPKATGCAVGHVTTDIVTRHSTLCLGGTAHPSGTGYDVGTPTYGGKGPASSPSHPDSSSAASAPAGHGSAPSLSVPAGPASSNLHPFTGGVGKAEACFTILIGAIGLNVMMGL